jgi:hypothetical protein
VGSAFEQPALARAIRPSAQTAEACARFLMREIMEVRVFVVGMSLGSTYRVRVCAGFLSFFPTEPAAAGLARDCQEFNSVSVAGRGPIRCYA